MRQTVVGTALLAIVMGIAAVAASGAEQAGPGGWSAETALGVQVAEFRVTGVDLLTALDLLDNECGLVFGFAGTGRQGIPGRITLDLKNVTVRQIVAELQKQSPGYRFETLDGVVTVSQLGKEGKPLAFLEAIVPAFDADAATPVVLEDRARSLLAGTKGVPRLVSPVRRQLDQPTVTLHLGPAPLKAVLAAVAAGILQSWVYVDLPERQLAALTMGRAWGLRPNAQCRVALAPGAPREPVPGALAPPDQVRERWASAILNGRLTLHDMDAAVAELVALVDDYRTRDIIGPGVADAIVLIGDLRAEEGAPALARQVLSCGASERYRERIAEWVRGKEGTDRRRAAEAAYDDWVRGFPAVQALVHIGQPSVEPIITALASERIEAAPGAVEPARAAEQREAKVILLCEALRRILGAEGAVARLRADAGAQKDAAMAKRLRDAADRSAGGLIPIQPPVM